MSERAQQTPLVDLDHTHGSAHAHARGEERTRWVVLLTAVMMVVELVVGRWTGSLALSADGWHMATHVGALGLSAVAYWFARTRATHEAFSFGTGKVYALAGYTSVILLAAVAIWMIIESIGRLLTPESIKYAEALPVAVIGLLVNLVSIKMLHIGDDHAGHDHGHTGHDHSHQGHSHDHKDHDHSIEGHSHHEVKSSAPAKPAAHHHDHNLRAAYFHVVADAMTSVLAIVALLVGRYLHFPTLDPIMGIVGAALILHWGYGLCQSAARQLLDASPSIDEEKALRTHLEAIDDVHVADLHLWEMGPSGRCCIVTLATKTPRDVAYYREAIRKKVQVAHLTVEVHKLER